MIAAIGLSLQVLQVLQVPQVPQVPASQVSREVIAEVRVHGNQIVPDAEVLTIAGVAIGAPFSDAILTDATKRLRDSRKFESVDVLKRFASIEDASRIIIVIIVSEGPVRVVVPDDPRGAAQVKKRGVVHSIMFIPILEGQDGYGLTYGARLAYPNVIGQSSRLSFPMTWGGTRRVGVELDRTFTSGPFNRIEFGGAVQRRRNPAYDEQDDRQRVWARVQRSMGPVRAGSTANWQQVSFGAIDDTVRSVSADVTLDTRDNPALPRNAVLATASVEKFFIAGRESLVRTRIEANGYVGLFGQQVLIVHAVREDANGPEPPYLRSILGGWSTLRGFRTGFLTGETLVAGSLEWRVPLRSVMKAAQVGVSAFADWATAYNHGQAFRDQPIYRGLGGTVWCSVLSLRVAMAVGYGRGSGTQVHFTGSFGF